MRPAFLICLVLLSPLAFAQDCTSYVVVNAFNPKLGIDILTLQADDLEARIDKARLEIVSSDQKYTSRLLVLDRGAFKGLVRGFSGVTEKILRILAQRIRALEHGDRLPRPLSLRPR